MDRRRLGTSLYAGLLFTILGGIAWVSGEPFIFPSLGPSAFLLAFERRGERGWLSQIVASHVIGGVVGFVAYSLFASGVTITATPPPGSLAGLRLSMSGILSIILTSWGMIAGDTIHAPACATTLIVSLGLLSTLVQVAIIVLSVGTLVTFHLAALWVFKRLVGDIHPVYLTR